jgi:putative drug exporter of the RND superfamily
MIFAAPMLAMLFSSIGSIVQGGFIIGVGLLLDTFVVRTITVPALAVLVGKANWWPSGRRRKPRPARRPLKRRASTSVLAAIRARLPKSSAIPDGTG